MKIPLNPDIGTRDGTLTKDAVCTNLIAGKRRPGVAVVSYQGTVIPTGVGYGLLENGSDFISVVDKKLYQTGLIGGVTPINPVDLTVELVGALGPVNLMVVRYPTTSYIVVGGSNVSLTSIGPVASNTPTITPLLPKVTVQGMVMLDQTLYVMGADGNIVGSNLGDITTWNALNSIAIDLTDETDKPQAITKVQSYLVAFSIYSTQFFYDNGNPAPGSPLSPAPSLQVPIGCGNLFSVANFSAGAIFVSMATNGKLGVHVITGTKVEKVSTDAVDKIFSLHREEIFQDSSVTTLYVIASVVIMNGKEVYVLYLKQVGLTLAFDISARVWGVLTKVTAATVDANGVPVFTEAPFDSAIGASFGQRNYVQNVGTGIIHQIQEGIVQGDPAFGFPVVARAVTVPIFDPGTNGRLRVAATEVLSDKSTEVAYLSYTDDDYQSWSTWRQLDLSTIRSRTVRDGSTHRRSYRLQYSGNTLLRFQELLLDIPERSTS